MPAPKKIHATSTSAIAARANGTRNAGGVLWFFILGGPQSMLSELLVRAEWNEVWASVARRILGRFCKR